MDRVYKSGGQAVAPLAAENASGPYPTAGVPGVTAPTKPGPFWFHMMTEELAQVILATGIALDKTSTVQLLAALRRLRGATSRVLGCDSKNNAGTPNTQFDLSAREVQLRDPAAGDLMVVRNAATKTVNILTAGPAVQGRDQAGAFANSSFVHLYWIGKADGTLDSIASASAENVGPTLPAGYTHWAYAGGVFLDAGGALRKVRIKGARVMHEAVVNALTNGTATVETAVSVSAIVPSNALAFEVSAHSRLTDNATQTANTVKLRVVTGVDIETVDAVVNTLSSQDQKQIRAMLPNIGQQFFYLWGAASPGNVTRQVDVNIAGYIVPNGGE